ncbi:MAG TPA: hypothetical protein VEY11_11210 [Pyrinomonadaceae bacterium]|nr:hypothetical protein [Pyrinomonadaceae bacterium]
MNLFSKVKKPFVFAALTLTVVLSSAFIPLNAAGADAAVCRTRYAKEITYYSDASYTEQVGVGNIYCNGTGTLDGTSTQYSQEQITDVCCGCLAC